MLTRKSRFAAASVVAAVVVGTGLLLSGGRNGNKTINMQPEGGQPERTDHDERIMVLVANEDLQEGVTITASEVRVRELRPDEFDAYEKNLALAMPPDVMAANLRVPKDPIRAGSRVM